MDPSRIRRRLLVSASAWAALAATGCASNEASSAATLAPSGRLRASINLGNPILAHRDPLTGELSGVSVDMARALAAQLGVEIDLVVFDAAGKSIDAVSSGAADIGFFALDPLRSEGIRFTAPYVLIEGAYLVRNDSPLTDNAQAGDGAAGRSRRCGAVAAEGLRRAGQDERLRRAGTATPRHPGRERRTGRLRRFAADQRGGGDAPRGRARASSTASVAGSKSQSYSTGR